MLANLACMLSVLRCCVLALLLFLAIYASLFNTTESLSTFVQLFFTLPVYCIFAPMSCSFPFFFLYTVIL